MNPQTQNPPGEAAIDQSTMQSVAPDVASSQGKGKLFEKAVEAHQAKQQLDAVLSAVANHIGATTSSRVKSIQTAQQKIVQKRLSGRDDYGIDSLGDMLGSRIVVDNSQDMTKAKAAIGKLAQAGVFKITKQEDASQGTYKGYHVDVVLSNGTKAEIQCHYPQTELEGISNHTLRSQYGEGSSNEAVNALRDKQAQVAHSLPNDKARAVSAAMQSLMKQQGGQLQPQQSAQLLAQAKQAGGGVSA